MLSRKTIFLLSILALLIGLTVVVNAQDSTDVVDNMCDVAVADGGWGDWCNEPLPDNVAESDFRWRLGWWIYPVEFEDELPCSYLPEWVLPQVFCEIPEPVTPQVPEPQLTQEPLS